MSVKMLTSFIPNFGQKNREQISYPDPGGASPVMITPRCTGHLASSSKLGSTSATTFPDDNSTCQGMKI